jgi:hypothetical protein
MNIFQRKTGSACFGRGYGPVIRLRNKGMNIFQRRTESEVWTLTQKQRSNIEAGEFYDRSKSIILLIYKKCNRTYCTNY